MTSTEGLIGTPHFGRISFRTASAVKQTNTAVVPTAAVSALSEMSTLVRRLSSRALTSASVQRRTLRKRIPSR